MLALLAQASAAADHNVLDIAGGIFNRPDTLAHPQALVQHLQALSVVWAVVLLIAGLVCLFNGYRFYKYVTVVMALVIGTVAGYLLGKRIGAAYIVAGCLAALLAVGVMPLMKYAVAVLGGLIGAFVGANAWTVTMRLSNPAMANPSQNCWVGALIGLIICGMLAFILFKLSIVLFTSVSGSTIAVLGVIALLLQIPQWRPTVAQSVSVHASVVPLLVLVPALIGLIMQHTNKSDASSKSSHSGSGSSGSSSGGANKPHAKAA